MKKLLLSWASALLLLACMASFGRADASVFSFSFTSDGPPDIFGNTAGTVTGEVSGLADNGAGQDPTSLVIMSSPIGLNGTSLSWSSGTFDVSGGVITGAHGVLFFNSAHNIGVAFNEACGSCNGVQGSTQYSNYLFDYVGQTTRVANLGGFGGTNYSEVAAVPEPSTWAMLLIGFASLGYIWLRQQRRIAAV